MDKQSFIDGVEFALDYGAAVPDPLMKKYYRIIKKKRPSKIKRFVKAHWKGLLAVLIFAASITLFFILNSVAEEIRGYKAVGGEIFALAIPFFIVLLRDLIHDFIDLWK